MRTAILPFMFIFNTDLLLIDVGLWHGVVIFLIATAAMLIFAAATQSWLIVRSRWYENLILVLVAFILFRPGFWMDLFFDPYRTVPPAELAQALEQSAESDNPLRLQIAGEDGVGNPRTFYVLVAVPSGATGEERLENLGLSLMQEGERTLIDMVSYGSQAAELGLDFDQEILTVEAPVDRRRKEWMWLPGGLLLALVVGLQWRRYRRGEPLTGHRTPPGTASSP
jgi:hypothetical protein